MSNLYGKMLIEMAVDEDRPNRKWGRQLEVFIIRGLFLNFKISLPRPHFKTETLAFVFGYLDVISLNIAY